MTVCGIEIKSDRAIIVILTGDLKSPTICQYVPPRLMLNDDINSEDIKQFGEAISGILKDNNVDLVGIKTRQRKGQYAGGSVGFKIEAIIQMVSSVRVIFVSPQKLSKIKQDVPDSINAYQTEAYKIAYLLMDEKP